METTDTELLQQIATLLSQPISISDIISLVLAAISVFAAIFVPYKIMEKQNKISVFEKRFQIYNELEKIYRFSESVENLKTLPGKPNPPDNEMAEANLYLWFNITNGLQFEMKKIESERRKAEKNVKLLEEKIFSLEEQKKEAENLLANPKVYSSGEKSREVRKKIEEIDDVLEDLNIQWMEAAEKLESFAK